MALLQVGLRLNDKHLESISEYQEALKGSPYTLDVEQTELNDGIAMIEVEDEEADRLMEEHGELGVEVNLPSGYTMEVECY